MRGALRAASIAAFMAGVSLGARTAYAEPAAPAPAAPAPAAPTVAAKEQAKKLFEDGIELEKKTDYAGALAKYREAEQLASTPGLRFHKGYCLEMTGKLNQALEEYEAAEKMARDQNKADVRAAVAVRLEPLRPRVPQIAIRVGAPARDAEVQVDGKVVAPALLDGKSFKLDPGEHKVSAKATGYRPWRRNVTVPEAVTTSVDIVLEPDPAAGGGLVAGTAGASSSAASESPPTSEPPEEPRKSRSVLLPVLTTTGAVLFLAAGIGTFAVAGGTKSDADIACRARVECEDEKSKVRTFDALALTGFVAAATLTVVSIVLWTRPAPASASASTGNPGSPENKGTAGARVVASPSSVGIVGSF